MTIPDMQILSEQTCWARDRYLDGAEIQALQILYKQLTKDVELYPLDGDILIGEESFLVNDFYWENHYTDVYI